MKAPFAYYGGKSGMASKIAGMFPPHRVYIEPFFGSGAVLFAKTPATHEIVNDLDGAVVAFFRCLRDRRDELTEACMFTPYARDEFDAADLVVEDLDDLEVARRFWVRVNNSFSQTAGRQTGWSVTTARTQSKPASVLGRIGRFEACADRLLRVSIEHCNAADLVRRLATPDAVVYADPPYLADTRRSRRAGSACADYRVDMGDTGAHEDLLDALTSTVATVFLSGYHSDLYDDALDGWHRIEWSTHAHGSNAVTTKRGKRTEVLWSNRQLSEERTLFDEIADVEVSQ